MNILPNKPWAKLLANNPDKESILLYNQLEELYEGQIKTGGQIYQKSPGDAWIKNLSASSIKINDNWLEVNEEKEISSGEKVSFNKDKNKNDESFDYVFILMTSQSKDPNKREGEEVPEPSMIASILATTKLVKLGNELQETLTCSICMEILHNCAALRPCEHSFCSFCLICHFKTSTKCPNCRVDAKSVRKNLDLEDLLEITFKNFPEMQRPIEDIEHKQSRLEGDILKMNGGVYVGSLKNGRIEGKGGFIYSNGDLFEGTWQNNKKEGAGTLTFESGYICKGQWLNDIVQNIDEIIIPKWGVYKGQTKDFQTHGKGVFKFNKGSVYDGNFVEGEFEGFGNYFYINGDEYEGNWFKGNKEGYGTMKSSNGKIYKGEWKNNKKEGKGVFLFSNGNRYEGSFVNNKIHGKGKYFWIDGAEFEGDYRESKREGYGTAKYPDGVIYEGQWENDEQTGDGVLTLTNGDKEKGTWANNVVQSVKKIYYANGDIYEGEVHIENPTKQGKGILTFKNGDRFEGYWENDKQHGIGREVSRDGKRIYEGVWKEGKMSGEIIMTDEDGIKYKAEWKKLDEGEKTKYQQNPLDESKDIDGQQDSGDGGNKEELN